MDKSFSDLKCEFECKAEDDAVATFTGVASTNDVDSDNDVIQAGAFEPIPMKKTPTGGDIPSVLMLRDHDRSQVIGGWTAVAQRGGKLLVEGELALAVEKARETYALMKRGFLSGLSVCFSVSDPSHISYDKNRRRVIKKATLRECSIVSFPANANARIVSVKSEVDAWLVERGFESGDLEKLLRQLKNNNGNGNQPPDPKAGEDRPAYMRRCMRATGGDVEGCSGAWDDSGQADKSGVHLQSIDGHERIDGNFAAAKAQELMATLMRRAHR